MVPRLLERYRQDPAPTIRPVDPEELRQAFLHRDQRKVTKTATFSFRGNRYSVPAFLRGQTIELRYDPLDLTHMEVWHRNTFLQLAEPERIVTTTHPDVEPDPVPVVPPENRHSTKPSANLPVQRLGDGRRVPVDTVLTSSLAEGNMHSHTRRGHRFPRGKENRS